MKFYYAPMESVGSYIYRNAHQAHFNHIDKYFAPFIVADQNPGFTTKDLAEILPANNQGGVAIPQILTNNAEDFIHTAKKIHQFGYDEINLNLGCPSTRVVSKNRGSGFLALREDLHRFLDKIYSNPVTEISVKTRVGKYEHAEIYELMKIFNQYPIKELTIHPRVQTDIYQNKPNLEVFKDALALSKNPVCYNGDIFTLEDYLGLTAMFPQVQAVMVGRGLLANPALVQAIKGHLSNGQAASQETLDKTNSQETLDKGKLQLMHNQIYQEYLSIMTEDRKALFKMKELWFYMIQGFTDHKEHSKAIMKSDTRDEYEGAVARLFEEREILEAFGYSK